MKELAKIKYIIDYKNKDYSARSFDLEILDRKLIYKYTDKDIKNISIVNTRSGYLMSHNGSEIRIISSKLFNKGSIGDLVNFKTPIIYTYYSNCDEIRRVSDEEFVYITLGPRNNPIELTFGKDEIVVVYPGSNTISSYEKWSNKTGSIKKRSNIDSNLDIYTFGDIDHVITENGIISEYNIDEIDPDNNDNEDDEGEMRKEFIYTDKGYPRYSNLLIMSDRSMHCYGLGDLSTNLLCNIHYISDIYKKYITASEETKYSFEKLFVFSEFVDPDKNYAEDFEDVDIILDPLFPEESMKGNKIRFDKITVSGDCDLTNTMERDNCVFDIEMTLYNPE